VANFNAGNHRWDKRKKGRSAMEFKWSTSVSVALAMLAAAVVGPTNAQAEDYPSRRIEFIVPWAAGSAVDVVARASAQSLEAAWKVPVTVDNRPGANSIIGSNTVKNAKPDGYQVLVTGAPFLINQFLVKEVGYDPLKDFKPVARLCLTELIMVVPGNSPFNNLKDLIAFAKKNPGKLSFGSNGNGSTTHLSGSMLSTIAGIELLHVPYKSGGQALTDTISGQLSINFLAIPTAIAQIKAGQLKAIGVTGTARSQLLPDVPTIAEAGAPGFDVVSWVGAFVPKDTPDAVVQKLSSELLSNAASAQFKEMLLQQGLEPGVEAGNKWDLKSEVGHWASVVKASGVVAE